MNRPALDASARAKLAQRLSERGRADTIVPRDPAARVPLSAAQRALWLDALVHPDSIAYNQQITLRATGALDDAALIQVWRALVTRHESLHTIVGVDDTGLPYAHLLAPHEIDAPVTIERCTRDAADDRIRAIVRVPFALEHDIPVRLCVLHHDDADHTVVVIAHHIALDNVSAQLLVEELLERYDAAAGGTSIPQDPPALQYGDYACWQAARLAGPRGDELTAFWAGALGAVPALELPTDRPRPPQLGTEGRRQPLGTPDDLLAAVLDAARVLGVTPYMFLFSAFAVTLARWSGQTDFAIGTPMAGRDRVELEDLVGFVSNTVAVPVHLGGNPTWREVLRATKATLLDVFAHADLPFERVVETVNPPRDPSRNAIFQVNFRIVPTGAAEADAGGAHWRETSVDLGYSKFDLALQLYTDHGLTGHVEYSTAIFDAASAQAFATAYGETLRRVAADPDVPLLALPAPVKAVVAAPTGPSMRRRRG